MRYPYERFLRFLVSRKVPIDKTIGKYGLPSTGVMWEAECRTGIRKTAPHSVVKYLDSNDQKLVARDGFLRWAEIEGILPLWEIQSEFGGGKPSALLDTAIQIFVNPYSRATVGLLLFSNAEESETLEFIASRLNLSIDSEALDLYKSIFWDIKTLERNDWQKFIAKLKSPNERHYLSLGLSSPSINDARRFLDDSSKLTPEQVLTNIMSKANNMFEAAMEQPDPEASGAIRWADLSIKAVTAIGVSRKALGADEIGELTPSEFSNMFSVTIEKTKHVSLAELQGEVSQQDSEEDSK